MSGTIKTGSAVVTINQGSTILVADEAGGIVPGGEFGLFARDTRLISCYRMLIQGRGWVPAAAVEVSYFSARHYLVSPRVDTPKGPIAMRQLELRIERRVGAAVHEDLDIRNHGKEPAWFRFAIEIASDFADIFEVKAHAVAPRGCIDAAWDADKGELCTRYRNEGFERGVVCRLQGGQSPPHYANGRVMFDVALDPGQRWHGCVDLVPVLDGAVPPAGPDRRGGAGRHDRLLQLWRQRTTRIRAPNPEVQRAFDQALEDMAALRLHEHDISDELWMPAGGLPWFATVFGRDSLIASLQCMLVNPLLGRGALKHLAAHQAKTRDDWRDAQPGKILHEMRFGELAQLGRVPHGPYYGTADATMLFLILLSEAHLWSGDAALLREHRDAALACLDWIDRWGDLDGDGFQEYRSFSEQGYRNMGWKDAHDAIVDRDGAPVDPPLALCELQGYVYDAKCRMASAFEALGEAETAGRLREAAADLQRRFEAAFWIEEEGCYAFCLDAQKRPVGSSASNPGHLLWSGIASAERAARVIERLLQPDMFSGWGIRTLSAANPAYNPHSYQCGSVWPHDNALIAAGAKRYRLWRQGNRIAGALFDASAAFADHRLPELFAGVERASGGFPVPYIGANRPQAWAAGAIFMLLRSILGISPDAPHGTLNLDPTLPEWLPELTVTGLRVGAARVSLRFSGVGAATRCEVLEKDGRLQIACAG